MKSAKLQTMGLMLALALILSYIESLLPLPFSLVYQDNTPDFNHVGYNNSSGQI